MGQRASNCVRPPAEDAPIQQGSAGATASQSRAQGQVQQAFATQVDWESVFEGLSQDAIVKQHYGELLRNLSPAESKVLQVQTLLPLAEAAYANKPGALPAKRTGILNGYRDFAQKKGVDWRADAGRLEARGEATWENERRVIKRNFTVPSYYQACYDGPLHSYNRGNGEWMAAFDAPSAYLLVHLHHFPNMSPQEAFDALHEELDKLALSYLFRSPNGPVRAVDIGCGVGTSTFSTLRSLEQAGRSGQLTGVDLSDYFITVAQHIKAETKAGLGNISLDFLHGDGLDLASCGFSDDSVDIVMISEVTHEMPRTTSAALFREAVRVLAPGGVLGYMDLNPVQILKENAVGNLVDRIATRNEPYFAEYLLLDVAGSMKAAGLEIVEETWPNHAKYPTLESCSLRIVVARKPADVKLGNWTGHWALERRENWEPYLTFLGVPEVAHEQASKAEDLHEYVVSESSFFMDHRIPSQGLHIRYTGFLDDQWQEFPYPRPTGTMFDEGSEHKDKQHCFKCHWVQQPTCFDSVMPNFGGKGKTVSLRRELVSMDEIKCTVNVSEPDSDTVIVGPCLAYFKRTSYAPPLNQALELKARFAEGHSRNLEWRLAALDKAAALALENVDAISAAQAADHVSPSGFQGASMMVRGALGFYKASLPSWVEPKVLAETAPPFMQTEGEWEVLPQPKGVGLVIAPWNAPVLLSILPLMGMLAAGNLCVLKPSEGAPNTSRLLARLVPKYFPDRSVLVAEGGKEVVEDLINTPVDHILFTGGGEIGKRILALAARHLTPVSLELGGKNPCFVDAAEPEQLALYAKEIVGLKSFFGGQFCQAQDYCLVSETVFEAFAKELEAQVEALGERRKCRMIHAVHARRVRSLLEKQEDYARPPLPEPTTNDDDTCVPVTLLVEPAVDSPVMQEEIFGPLLPLIKVSGAKEAVEFVRKRPKPLVAYCYSPDPQAWEAFRLDTSSGNLAVNCGPQRMQGNFNAGFGGAGESGYGYSIWGRAAFDDYSHHKTIFKGKKFAGSAWGAAPPPPQAGR